jgi:hypothetical protein
LTHIFSAWRNDFTLKRAQNQRVEVGRLSLPIGRYSIWAKFYLGLPQIPGVDSQTVQARLEAGNDFDVSRVSNSFTTPGAVAALNVVHFFPVAGAAVLTCEFPFRSGETDILFIKITAVNADSLTNTRIP